jgi:hypothetical protein
LIIPIGGSLSSVLQEQALATGGDLPAVKSRHTYALADGCEILEISPPCLLLVEWRVAEPGGGCATTQAGLFEQQLKAACCPSGVV